MTRVSKFLKRSVLNLVGSELVRNCEKLLILSQFYSFSDFLLLALARMAFFYSISSRRFKEVVVFSYFFVSTVCLSILGLTSFA